MSELRALFKQSSHYFAGRVLMMAAGFISFPILTRILSVDDYGILGLVTTTVLISTALCKMGFQESAVRFYSEYRINDRLDELYSTLIISSTVIAIVISISFVVAQEIFDISTKLSINRIAIPVALMIISGCSIDIILSFMRAGQFTKIYNIIATIRRYGALLIGIVMTLYLVKGINGYLYGQAISGMSLLIFLIIIVNRTSNISINKVSYNTLKKSIYFGLPLVWNEIGALILNYIDRYFIQYYMGALYLGLYTAGYNLATYVTEIVIYPINYAMAPIFMDILENKGEREAKLFFSKTFSYFLLMVFPVAIGLIAVGRDLVTCLASKRYAESSDILPYIVIGQIIHASTLILNSGLFIKKKTYLVTIITIISGIINIIINIVMIPKYGIIGAAISTVISYTIYAIIITYYSFREFSFEVEIVKIVKYLLASIIMYFVVIQLNNSMIIIKILFQVIVGVISYIAIVLVLDGTLRKNILTIISK